MTDPLVLAIHPRHAQAILAGDKQFEIRRRFPQVPAGTVVYMYATAPICAIVGGFVVETRHSGAPEQLWSTVGEKACISHAEFSAYVQGNATATAVKVRSSFRLRRDVERDELAGISGGSVSPPQSVQYIRSAPLKAHLEALAPAEATLGGRLL